jgi:hypothetical protein
MPFGRLAKVAADLLWLMNELLWRSDDLLCRSDELLWSPPACYGLRMSLLWVFFDLPSIFDLL